MKSLTKVLALLSSEEKKNFFFLLILIIIMALIDVLGVASILPFLMVLANPDLIESNQILSFLYKGFAVLGVNTIQEFIFFLGIMFFLLFFFSLIIKSLTTYAQIRFSLMREYSISKRLIEGYLCQPYNWFLKKNSSDLSKSILSEVSIVVTQTIMMLLILIAQSSVALAILALLIMVDPILALSIGTVLTLANIVIYLIMKKLLTVKGSERLLANTNRFKSISEAFGAIKEVKFGGLEQVYVNRFANHAKIYANNQSFARSIADLPRYFIEGIAFGGMIILVLFQISRDSSFASFIPIVGLYAFAGYRLMPAIQQIYHATSNLRFSGPTLDSLHKDLMNLEHYIQQKKNVTAMPLRRSINLKKVYFNYHNINQPTLENISFEIQALSKIGIVGPTGSGKTTLVDIILGLLDPSQGALYVDDNLISENNKRSWQKSIGYVPQQIYLTDESIIENIAFGVDIKNIDKASAEQAAKIANIHEFIINELPQGYNTIAGERGIRLSGGQRQRIGIARALYHKPKVIILDEATSSLDNATEKVVMEAMQSLDNKITMIIIAHRLTTIKKCDTILFMEKGRLKAQGTYNDLLGKHVSFEKIVLNN